MTKYCIVGLVPGSDFYREKGLSETVVIYVSRKTYFKLKRLAERQETSLQKLVRKILDNLPEDLP